MDRGAGAASTADPAAALLVECMRGVAGERPLLRALAADPVDWERFLVLARDHAVAETVQHALGAHGAGGLLPAPVRTALREAQEEATARNALLLAEASRIQLALAEAGIPSALLKGTALVGAHYPAIGARHVADVDLLVHPDQLGPAREIAVELGGVPLAPPMGDASAVRPLAQWEKHAPPLLLSSGVVVELHRRFGEDRATEAATAAILSRARGFEWGGRRLRAAAPDDLFGVACHHVFVGHRSDRRFRPRHLADCAVRLAAGARPSEAAALPGAAEHVRRSIFEIERGAGEGLTATPASRAAVRFDGLRRVVARGSVTEALRTLFFPDRDFMAWRYGISRSSRLLPLAYLWRPVRGAWRLVTGR